MEKFQVESHGGERGAVKRVAPRFTVIGASFDVAVLRNFLLFYNLDPYSWRIDFGVITLYRGWRLQRQRLRQRTRVVPSPGALDLCRFFSERAWIELDFREAMAWSSLSGQ